jgi:hypothetical protein
MSNNADTNAQLRQQRQKELCDKLQSFETFLMDSRIRIKRSDYPTYDHLNTRLLIQCHLTDVLEASHTYDVAVTQELTVAAKSASLRDQLVAYGDSIDSPINVAVLLPEKGPVHGKWYLFKDGITRTYDIGTDRFWDGIDGIPRIDTCFAGLKPEPAKPNQQQAH